MNERNADTHVLVAEEEFLITLVHFPCLLLPQTVDDFVFIQQESLPDIVRRDAGIVERSKLRSVVFVCQQSLSCRIEEVDTTCCGVHFHLDGIAAQCHIFPFSPKETEVCSGALVTTRLSLSEAVSLSVLYTRTIVGE